MNIKRFFQSFQRLQWKLTFNYMLVTVASLLVLQILFILTLSIRPGYVRPGVAFDLIRDMRIAGQALVPALSAQPVEREEVQAWVESVMGQDLLFGGGLAYNPERSSLTVLAPDGTILESSRPDLFPRSTSIFQAVPADELKVIENALMGIEEEGSLYKIRAMSAFSFAIPVFFQGDVAGVVFIQLERPTFWESAAAVVRVFLSSLILFSILALLMGSVFGLLMARGITNRLNHLAKATSAWGRGELSVRIEDLHGDEISELAGDLNRMAAEFENLLKDRQDLAALEERNRLARDLHDSVKQQVFAISMNLGAAESLWGSNAPAALEQLQSAKALARQAQAELSNLIQMLRPIQLKERGLVEALREQLKAWEKHSGAAAIYQVEGDGSLSEEASQAVFRVAQEALSNISRHSQATAASVALVFKEGSLEVSIRDNGHGFDPDAVSKGMGLKSMQERIQSVGGKLNIRSTSAGTVLSLQVPQGDQA